MIDEHQLTITVGTISLISTITGTIERSFSVRTISVRITVACVHCTFVDFLEKKMIFTIIIIEAVEEKQEKKLMRQIVENKLF